MKNTILLYFICLSSILYAQTDFRQGKIIKLNGDTISGELDYQGDITNSELIRFKNHYIDSVFKPFEIKSYHFENGKHYVSKIAIIANDSARIFAEYLVNGEKDLFFSRSVSGFHYLISMSDTVIKEIPFKVEIVNIDGVNYQKESKYHIGYLKTYFNDCPTLFPKIEELNSLKRKSLISLTEEYHDITCGEGTCIIYDRKEYPVKIAIEPIYSYYTKNLLEDDIPMNAYGGNVFLWLPNSSERLYIKTGLYYSQLLSFNYFQVPLQFEYVYPFKVIKPKINLGVNMHFARQDEGLSGHALTALAGVGCYVPLTNWVELDFDISSDLFEFSYATGLFESFAIRTGIVFKINN